MFVRVFEASSWAGIAAAIHAIAALVAAQGADAVAWGQLAASIAAVLIPEHKAA